MEITTTSTKILIISLVKNCMQIQSESKNYCDNSAGTFAWTLTSHLPHFNLVVPSTARVFRGNCHMGHNEECVSIG